MDKLKELEKLKDFELSDINVLLIAVLLIIAFFVVYGYRKGLIRIAISLVSMVIWIWVISWVTPYISDFIKNETDLYDIVTERINEAFKENNAMRDNTIAENHVETIESYNLPGIVKELLIKNDTQDMYDMLVAKIFEEYVSKYLADLVIRAVSFAGAYFMAMLIMKLTLFSAEFISRLPIINGFNRYLGAAVGLAEGLLAVFLIFAVCTFVIGRPFYDMVRQSRFLSMIYDNNFILSITGGSFTK